MKEYLDFIYDGVPSKDIGVIQAYRDLDLFEESFMSSRSIIEEKVRGNSSPYFFGVDDDPLEFTLGLFFSDELQSFEKRKIARFLNKKMYAPLKFNEKIDQIYYCLPEQSINYIHDGLNRGFIELTMRCDSPYSYSPTYKTDERTYENTSYFDFYNNGDENVKPIIYLKKIGQGNIEITNLNNNQKMELTNLENDEIVIVNSMTEEVETDIPSMYRYNDFNNVYLEFPPGKSKVKTNGSFVIKIEYRLRFLQNI